MSKLKELVPPLELCNLIPEGAFADSALIWHVQGSPVGYMKDLERRDELHAERFGVVLPAPTLEEIMAAMARMEVCPGVDMRVSIKGEICGRVDAGMQNVSFCGKSTPAEAALKRWLSIEAKKC